MKHFLPIVSFVLIFTSWNAYAEITYCEGRWTNLPCKGQVKETLTEIQTPLVPEGEASALNEKKKLFRDLDLKNATFRRRYDEKFDIKHIEDFCLRQNSPVEDCREKVEKAEDRIDKKAAEFETARSQQRVLELQEEVNRLERERQAKQEQNQNTAIVIQENEGIPWYRYKHGWNGNNQWDRDHGDRGKWRGDVPPKRIDNPRIPEKQATMITPRSGSASITGN